MSELRRVKVEAVQSGSGQWQVRYVDSGTHLLTVAKGEVACRKVAADLNAGVQAAWDAVDLARKQAIGLLRRSQKKQIHFR